MESCKWCSWRSGYFTKLFYMFLHKIANTIGFRPGRCHTLRVPWWCWCHDLHTNSNEIANTFFFTPDQCRTLRVPWGQGGEVGKGSQPEDQKWWIYDDLMMISWRRWWFDGAMIFWWWYRCEERYADVDVHPGEEDREGGVQWTVQLVWEQKKSFRHWSIQYLK